MDTSKVCVQKSTYRTHGKFAEPSTVKPSGSEPQLDGTLESPCQQGAEGASWSLRLVKLSGKRTENAARQQPSVPWGLFVKKESQMGDLALFPFLQSWDW